MKKLDLINISKKVRKKIIEISYATKSHHIGSALSCVEILVVLYFRILKLNPKTINNINKNWMILSKGHGALALYIILSKIGFFKETLLKKEFLTNGGKLGVHPEKGSMPGIEISSGSLGHGLSIANGIAISKKRDGVKGNVYVLISDGECNEGMVWEAALFSSHHNLNNIIVIIDNNKFQALGKTKDILNLSSLSAKFKSFDWNVTKVNGHKIDQLEKILKKKNQNKPMIIVANTIKGKGVKSMENKLHSHYRSIQSKQEKDLYLNDIDKN